MKMTEITKHVIGYNNKTKTMNGILVLYDIIGDFHGTVIFDSFWVTDECDTENIHEFIKKYKYGLNEYLNENSGFIFLPYKKNISASDIKGNICLDEDWSLFYRETERTISDSLIDDYWQEIEEEEYITSFYFDMNQSKELTEFLKTKYYDNYWEFCALEEYYWEQRYRKEK